MNNLRPISTLNRVRGDRILGYDEKTDIYSVMMWNGAKWVTIPGSHDFRPTHWQQLPVVRQSRREFPANGE